MNERDSSQAAQPQPGFTRPPGQVDCAVVIVTYNSAHCIAGLLKSLPAAAPGLALRTIVVDNGSSDETALVVRNNPGVTLVETGANLGYAGGINVGRKAAGDYSALLVLNPDVVLDAGSITRMHTALRDPAVGIVVPALLDAEGQTHRSLRREPTLPRAIGDGLLGDRISGRPSCLSEVVRDDHSYQFAHAIDWATGAVFLISAACDRAVGDWDERFFLYCEETDYAHRARAAGFRVEYHPSAHAWHREGASGSSAQLVALWAINRIRYIEKHGHSPTAYRLAVVLHELLRGADPDHRTVLRVVLRKRTWPALVDGLKGRYMSSGTSRGGGALTRKHGSIGRLKGRSDFREGET